MIVTMDLNASPLPDDDEEPFDIHSEVYVPEDHQETAVETARRVLIFLSSLSFYAYLLTCLCPLGAW